MSLRLKMILGIGAILLLVILVFAILASSGQGEPLLRAAKHEADLVAHLTERAVANSMEHGEQETVQAILEHMGESPGVVVIRILDRTGRIVRSSKKSEIGLLLPRQDQPPVEESVQPSWDLGKEAVGVFRPIRRAPQCSRCHARGEAVLGLLNVRVRIPAEASEIQGDWTFMVLAGVGGLLVAGGMIWLLFTYVVGQRIDGLAHTMGHVESGDLTARVIDDSRDEIGRLATSFNAMVAHLADARRQLEDRHAEEIRRSEHLASLGKMAAGIAHEINNPIAGMLNCVRTLRKGVRDEGQRIQYLHMVQEGLGRIGRTVGQLLNFAREAKPELARTDLESLLQQCLALLEEDLTARRIVCSLRRDGNLPEILADPHQLEQVFLNILKNSMEAMPDGGRITVSMSMREAEGGPFLEVRVADTGIGIPAEHLPLIFDPFFTTKEVGKGTGLGLSVSYGIVRAHGGYIEVKSEVGKGSLFIVGLPVGEG
jgi:two-component system NtrC family sensor kinase